MDINFEPDAMEQIYKLTDEAFERHLGPMMELEVKRNAPKDTGKLAESVEASVSRTTHKLYIQAYGDNLREAENRKYYAAWVDLGHEIVAWGNRTGNVKPPTAFMRRALYKRYPGF